MDKTDFIKKIRTNPKTQNKRGDNKISKMNIKFLLIIVLIFATFNFVSSNPLEVSNITEINSSRPSAQNPDSVEAEAGYVTELSVFGYSNTRSWQGYYGNVTGSLILSDASRNTMYNWSVLSPRGQIYSSTNSSIQWQNTQCFNYTAAGNFSDDTANAGSTSLYGTNLTQLESRFNIPYDAADGVNETFIYSGASGHVPFYVGNLEFSQGECKSTRIYGSGGTQNQYEFEEVLLYEPQTTSTIFTSILNNDLLGFNGKSYDFQMIVLEDGRGTDTSTTEYYFYLEIE
ncbi:MAG: hypothetical protein ACOC3Z_03020 [Nanoarchaeota archaeon]